ncbi:MAG: hypothetical protein F6K17_38465 [Okeania sp. SIO3C4]|nr:hypothetical protein [Okeania sp. SIO3B3]NER08020.1 hypothetical protein [Okeania sp. SIO3C4]
MTTTYSTLETLFATSSAIFPGVGGGTFRTNHVLNSTTFIITFQQRQLNTALYVIMIIIHYKI